MSDMTNDSHTLAKPDIDVLLQALPYIQKFRGRIVVVKFGGNAMESPELFDQFATDVVLMHSVGLKPVIVHGGGPQIGEWMAKLGRTSEFVDGQRVTDAETLEIARMVLIGKVNSDIISALNSHGPVAVGLSGQAARLIEAAPMHPELGFVGDVVGVNTEIIDRVLGMDMVPVISTIASDSSGQAYNINADVVASAVAGALDAFKLIFLTDVAGILADANDPSTLIHTIAPKEIAEMMATGAISGGMIPKVQGCLTALDGGVEHVHLIDGRLPHVLLAELFTDAGVGTMLVKDAS